MPTKQEMSITSLGVLFLLLPLAGSQIRRRQNLCIIFGKTHTMCLPDKKCNTAPPLTRTQKDTFLDLHNKLRAKIAIGQISPQPGAGNMQILRWNNELAKVAQKWADNCYFDHDINRYTGVGQNLYQDFAIRPPEFSIRKAVMSWFNEHKNFDPQLVDKAAYSQQQTDYYTQLCWAETTNVGCGYSRYREENNDVLMVVCNYGPRGNVLNMPLYKVGEACSDCADKCSVKYDGLCDPKHGKPKNFGNNKGEKTEIGIRNFGLQIGLIFCASDTVMF